MLQFISPWMLAGLTAAGLPVFIHFLTRARPRVIRYPTYHLLLEAGSGRQSLNRLRTWVILTLRTLAAAALVGVFARPYLATPGVSAQPGEARRVALVVDASMSTRATEAGVPVFTRARAQAADLLRALPSGSAASVIFVGAQPRSILPALSQNLAALHNGLAQAEPTAEGGDPAAALALAAQMLQGAGAVYVFSDFQRTNWAAVDFASYKGLSFFLHPVVKTGVENLGIVGIEKSPDEPVEGETVALTCTVFNSSPVKRTGSAHLDLEGVTQTAEIELQPYSSGAAAFSFSPPAGQRCFPGKVTLDHDALADDNVRYFRVRVRRSLRILLVSDAGREELNCPAFFVAKALAPSSDAAGGLEVLRRMSQEVDRTALETADAFFLVAPVTLTGQTADVIARRVTDGACAISFLDGPAAPGLVNALAGASAGALSPPFQLLRPVGSADARGESFAVLRTQREPLKLFDGPDQGDLAGLLMRRHFLTENVGDRSEEVLITYADGSVALSISPAGRGTAVFANLPLAAEGGNLTGSPLFPVILAELLRTLRHTTDASVNTPGKPWTYDVSLPELPAGADKELHVSDPTGRDVPTTVLARGRTVRLALPAAELPGHYPIRLGTTPADLAVVNVDARETDTRPMTVADLASAGEAGQASVAVVDDEGRLATAGIPTALWPHLAALAALCLTIEMLLLAVWRRMPKRVGTQTLSSETGRVAA